MTNVLKKGIIGAAVAATVAVTASPADAQYRRHRHHGDDAAWAVGAGIVGLGIGAAIASSNRGYYGNGYYDNGYYDRGYYGNNDAYYGRGYYDRGYYGRGSYGRRCVTRREYDPYWGRWVRVRYC
ncbi:MAG TPA: hypothetical protein VGD66_08950 [Allosphingosinicella sp.]|jgi:hypothetical protein